MKIKVYVIDLEIPRRAKRLMLLVGVPATALLGIVAIAYASGGLTSFNPGDQLSATTMNGNFNYLQGEIASLQAFQAQATADGGYSLGATYCGTGPTNTTGAISYNGMTGYVGAKAMCQASTGCLSSATAHMCTTEELARSVQAGILVPQGWYSAAIYASSPGSVETWDCAGWTSTNGNWVGPVWTQSPEAPSVGGCATTSAVLCCD